MIHPTAIISKQAKLDATVQVGPYSIIDGGVELGAGCVVGPHVYLTGLLTAGTGNRFHTGCVIGDEPQDLKYDGTPTRVRIGDNNVFREHVTVHRATNPDGETIIGSNNLLMANAHVGHNSHIHNHVILANGVLLAGHVTIFDRAFLSGNAAVHQFVRVGTLALMQGLSGVTQDLPPYTISARMNQMRGLNIIGLRRAGVPSAERLELKRLYRDLFRSGKNLRAAVAESQGKFQSATAKTLLAFVAETKRGICTDARSERESAKDSH